MVREPHRTHGNKTRISSFTDSRTTTCAPCHTPTPISTLSPLVFRCPSHTAVQNIHFLQRASPGHTCHGVTPGPCMYNSHRLLPSTVPRSRVFRLSLSVYTDVHNITKPPRLPPVIRVTALPRAHVCHTHTVYHSGPLPRSYVCFSGA